MEPSNGQEPKVFIALPSYNGQSASKQLYSLSAIVKKGWLVASTEFSSLAHSFNRMWADCLNRKRTEGFTHFVMCHADIVPHGNWIQILLDEMKTHGADIISAISPIKDHLGITSTGRMRPDVKCIERFTMHQVYQLPETFTFPDIVLNTGCMCVNLAFPFVEQLFFRFQDWIEKNEKGEFVARTVSEDWLFSADAASMGAKLYATRKVKLEHIGTMHFGTHGPWGQCQRDPNFPDSVIDQAIQLQGTQKQIIVP